METIEIPFGFAKDGKIYLSGWAEHPDRPIGEIREDDLPKSVQFFVDRYADLERKVNEVFAKIDATENKGSFLMKLLHLKEVLPQHDGLGDYVSLLEQIGRYESLVKDIIVKNRARNSEIKTALIQEARDTVELNNWKEATVKVNDLKNRWIKTGNAEEDKNEQLEEDFWALIKGFFDRKKQFYEDKLKLVEIRTRQYEELVAESLKVKELDHKSKFDRIKELRSQWKDIGGVPAEVFKPLVEQFNANLKARREPKPVDYSELLTSLEAMKAGTVAFNGGELEHTRKQLFNDKRKNSDKARALELIQLLNEREFINKIAEKRFSNFSKMDPDKKRNIRRGIIRDLISRDKEDLKTFEENSANFSSADGKFSKMVAGKISGQKRRISVKEKLLKWFEEEEK